MVLVIWLMAVVLLSWAISQIVFGKESFIALLLQVVWEGLMAILRLVFALLAFVVMFIVTLFKKPPNGKAT